MRERRSLANGPTPRWVGVLAGFIFAGALLALGLLIAGCGQ